jgi:DNA replication protein DnaC
VSGGDHTVKLPPGASSSDVRRAMGFGMRLDMIPVTSLAARRSGVFVELEDGVYGLKLRCRCCSVEAVHRLEFEDDAGQVIRNRLSAIEVWIAQRWCCEACGLKETEALERSKRSDAARRRIQEAGIPGALAAEVSWKTMLEGGATPDETVRRTRAIEVCRLWSEKPEPGHAILLYGDTGTGKTRLAATAAMARLQHSPIVWVSVAVLMAQLSAAWGDDDRKAALKVLTGKGPVVLDDLDKVNPTQSQIGHVFTALDRRVQAKQRALIITTNRKPSELEKIIGDVNVSRILELCGTQGLLPFPGPDRRLELGEHG